MNQLSDLAAHCIRCGFCLESCPTFVLTGNEAESPRGRIYLVRSILEGKLEWDGRAREHLDRCLGCRACETSCPSGVEYGRILEMARERFEHQEPRKALHLFVNGLTNRKALELQLMMSGLLPEGKLPKFVSRVLTDQDAEAEAPKRPSPVPWPQLEEHGLPPVRGEVYLLEGCAMRVLYPDVHEATRRLLRRVGYVVRPTESGCCGSMHLHLGFEKDAKGLAEELVRSMPDDLPVIVNSAGCGSALKEYHHFFGPEYQGFARRCVDVSVFLHEHGLKTVLAESTGLGWKVTYHDACHLSHGQKVWSQPRELIASIPGVEMVDLPESDLCCGSAGTFNLTQPRIARQLLDRKWENIVSTGADAVVLGNPGCQTWIAQASREKGSSVRVMHTADLLESAFSGPRAPY